jgi:hypothetical protein
MFAHKFFLKERTFSMARVNTNFDASTQLFTRYLSFYTCHIRCFLFAKNLCADIAWLDVQVIFFGFFDI